MAKRGKFSVVSIPVFGITEQNSAALCQVSPLGGNVQGAVITHDAAITHAILYALQPKNTPLQKRIPTPHAIGRRGLFR